MKKCPCCDYEFSLLNYHLHTRMLPEDDTNYKSLHCLECNHKIQKKESVTLHYMKNIITFIVSVIFAFFIRMSFNLWQDIDIFVVNIPFIILFYILKYIFDYYFGRLECYDQEVKKVTVLHENGRNLYGIFGKKEQQIAEKAKYIVFWILTIIVLLVIFTNLK